MSYTLHNSLKGFWKKGFTPFLLLAVTTLVAVWLGLYHVPSNVDAQEHSHFKELVEDLNTRQREGELSLITFQFVTPLIEDEPLWFIGDPDDEYGRQIAEIGDDYLCFQETRGGARGLRCTLFTNIASVIYLTN